MNATQFLQAAGLFGIFAVLGAVSESANNQQCHFAGALGAAAVVWLGIMALLKAIAIASETSGALKHLPAWAGWVFGLAVLAAWLVVT